MMRSMFAGVSGMRAHQTMLDVVGDNIANINTPGFKASRAVFQDTLSQMLRGPGAGSATRAATNAAQIGLGTRVAGVDLVFTQGAAQTTGRATDIAIQGDGFFVVRSGDERLYTRAGNFGFDRQGLLADATGAVVQGWLADANGLVTTTGPVTDLRLPLGSVIPPEATRTVNVGGNLSADAAVGETVKSSIEVVDALGATHTVGIELAKAGGNTWTMTLTDAAGTALGAPATVTFDPATGAVAAPATAPSFTLTPGGGAPPLTFEVSLGSTGSTAALTQFGGTTTAAALGQDGSETGYLRSFAIADDGTVSGVFSNGQSATLARLAVATFNNPAGMVKAGDAHFRANGATGDAQLGVPGTAGRGTLAVGTLEMSNVDLAQEFTNLIIAQRGFQANSRVITSSDELLQDLVNLKR